MSDKRLMSIKFKGIDQTYIIPTVIADDANNDGNVVVKNYPSEAYAQHSVDKANPHSVTAEQVGAAPATEVQGSYTITDAADLDATLTSIINSMELSSRRTIHVVYQGTTPINKGDWFMVISKTADANYGSVEATHDYALGILKKYRSYYSGAWTDWVNIPNHGHTAAEIGAVPTSRTINEKALSSNITLNASDVGAAPSGYGVGSEVKSLSSADNLHALKVGGRYGWASDAPQNAPAQYLIMDLMFRDKSGTYGVANFYTTSPFAIYQSFGRIIISNGEWGEFEWENPPLHTDKEYRTTERFDDRVVFKKKDSNGVIMYRLDGENSWTNGLPGAAPAYVKVDATLTTAGWYKVGTIKPVGGDFTTACRLSIGGNYNTINHSSAIIDIITDYDSMDAVVVVPTVKTAGVTQVGFIRTEMKTFDVYVGYANNSTNAVYVSADMSRGTFIKANFVASSVAESAMAKVIAINKSSFAPSGYGLGETSTYCENCNSVYKNGWYEVDTNTANLPAEGTAGTLFIHSIVTDNGTDIYQTIKSGVTVIQRYYSSWAGAWQPWEWVNPPMQAGVEYRTTERYMGMPVYVKMIEFGLLPNATSKNVAHGITGKSYNVRSEISCTGSGQMVEYNPAITWVAATNTDVYITTDADFSTYAVYFTLWYTK